MLATLEVQKAIYEVLTEYDLDVHSTLPIDTKLPYVQFTSIQVIEKSNKSGKYQSYHVSLSAWCVDSTSINIHEMVKKIVELTDVELDLGEEYSHDTTVLENLMFNQQVLTNRILNRAIIELRIDVSENI